MEERPPDLQLLGESLETGMAWNGPGKYITEVSLVTCYVLQTGWWPGDN